MKIIRTLAIALAIFVPTAAFAGGTARAACEGCADHCPMSGHCPFC